jgi:hypothetical protein
MDRRGKPSRHLTIEDAKRIWQLRQEGEIQSRIAAELDVNQGRVSEVLTGLKFPELRQQITR